MRQEPTEHGEAGNGAEAHEGAAPAAAGHMDAAHDAADPAAQGHDEAHAGATHTDTHAVAHDAAASHGGGGGHAESPLSHVVQHPLIQQTADYGLLTPEGKITVFSDQIAMIALAGVLLIALVPMIAKRRRKAAGVDAMVPTGSLNGIR